MYIDEKGHLIINKIHHGDCIDLIKLIPSNSVQLIVSDPPYFLGMTHNGQRGSFVDLAICKPFFKELFKEYKRILTPTGEVYFFTDWRGFAFYYPLFDAILGARNVIAWDKMSGAGNFYAFQHEFIMFHCVDNATNKKGGNVWRSKGFAAGAKVTDGEKVHPTQKTIAIIEKIVTENTKPGDVVCDTFGGSGTTAVVCRKTGRDFYVMELDEDNIDIALTRQEKTKTNGIQSSLHDVLNFPQIDTVKNPALIEFKLLGDLREFEREHGPHLEALGMDKPTAQGLIVSIWHSLNRAQVPHETTANVLKAYEEAPPLISYRTATKAAGTNVNDMYQNEFFTEAEQNQIIEEIKTENDGN